MMAHSFSDRDRRALLIGAAVLLVASLALRGIPALVRWTTANRDRAERFATAAVESRQSSESLASLRDSASVRTRRAALLDSLFLSGSSTPLAAASLASELSDAAQESGVHLGAVQSDPVDSAGASHGVRAHASISGDLGAIMRFLLRIENGPPLLSVKEISLSQHGQGAQPEAIHAELVVEGLNKAPARRGPAVSR